MSTVSDIELEAKSIKQLTYENPDEYVELVSRKTCKDFVAGNYSHSGYDIEIPSNPIVTYTKNGTPGYEFYARVFKNGVQVGFGSDGSVDIERFRVYGRSNFLVEDVNGNVLLQKTIKDENFETIYETRTYREDLQYCILMDIVHTIQQIGKDDKGIKEGKVGNTTSTFYPPRTTGNGSGYFTYRGDNNGQSGTFAQWRGRATVASRGMCGWVNNGGNFDPDFIYSQMNQLAGNQWQWNVQPVFQFDTSTITDTDTIDSATYSICSNNDLGTPADNLSSLFGLTVWDPASETSWVAADQTTYLGTRLATDIAFGSLSAVGTYTNFALNSDGKSAISKTSWTDIMLRLNWDIDNTSPGTTGVHQTLLGWDKGDDISPAKLVVVHSAPTANSNFLAFF